MTRLISGTIFATAFALLPVAAHAGAPGGFGISATVPEVCGIDASEVVIQPGDGQVAGSVSEMCNSGRGFRVMASHRSLAQGEAVEIIYAGQAVQLDAMGISELAYGTGPVARHVPVLIRSNGLVETLAISIGIMAI